MKILCLRFSPSSESLNVRFVTCQEKSKSIFIFLWHVQHSYVVTKIPTVSIIIKDFFVGEKKRADFFSHGQKLKARVEISIRRKFWVRQHHRSLDAGLAKIFRMKNVSSLHPRRRRLSSMMSRSLTVRSPRHFQISIHTYQWNLYVWCMCHDTFWWGGTPPTKGPMVDPPKVSKNLIFWSKSQIFGTFCVKRYQNLIESSLIGGGGGGTPPYLSK